MGPYLLKINVVRKALGFVVLLGKRGRTLDPGCRICLIGQSKVRENCGQIRKFGRE